jgi:hypothetical protein
MKREEEDSYHRLDDHELFTNKRLERLKNGVRDYKVTFYRGSERLFLLPCYCRVTLVLLSP